MPPAVPYRPGPADRDRSYVPALFGELARLEEKGLRNVRERLLVSDRCHIITDCHQQVDGLEELELGANSIGTTKRGIGPTYSTMAARTGITISEMFDEALFERKLRVLATGFKKRYGDQLQYDVDEELARFKTYREELRVRESERGGSVPRVAADGGAADGR